MQERRLAAIMFTDIVGYTALMGSDEDKAFEILRKNREIHSKLIKQFNGTLIKEMGDGMLISFDLASEAVRCAIEIQKTSKTHDIPLKIGIHEAEMVFEGNDVLGDGVNVASRIQDGAAEGCILISGSVYRDIKNKADIQTEFVGEQQFKNVDEPIKVYEVLCDEEVPKQLSTTQDKGGNPKSKITYYVLAGIAVITIASLFVWKSIPLKEVAEIDKSLGVLPFWNESTDKENEHWVNGMTEDIRSNLSKIPELRVIPRPTMEKYRDKKMSSREIADELDVSYLLAGSVQKADNQLKVNVQLILASVDDYLWQETYIRDVRDIKLFDIQSEISQSIAKEIGMNLSSETKELIESIPTRSLTAYDFYLKGEDYLNRGYDRVDKQYAIDMYNKAIELDSSYTLAWIGLFNASRYKYNFNMDKNDERSSKIKFYLDYAIKLDSNLWEVKLANAKYLRNFKGKQNKAIQILEELKSQYPKNTEIYLWLGAFYKMVCNCKNAINNYDIAIKLDPSNWNFWHEAAINYQFCRDYVRSEECLLKTLDLNPTLKEDVYWRLAQLYYLTGDQTRLKEFLVENNSGDISDDIRMALLQGNYEDAVKKLINTGRDIVSGEDHRNSNNFRIGLINHLFLDKEKASEYLKKEKSHLENKLSVPIKNIDIYRQLAIVYAALGEKANAISAANKHIQLINTINVLDKIDSEINMANCLLLLEEYDEGISKLEDLLQTTGKISVEYLKNHWRWRAFMKNEKYRALVNNPKYQLENLPKLY